MPDAAQNKPGGVVEAKVLATLFNISVRRIQQLTQDGILTTEVVDKKRRYNLLNSVRAYIAYLQQRVERKGATKEDTQNESKKIEAEADLKSTKARIAKLELQELEGQMHSSEDVEAMTTQLVFTIRGMLLSLPGRLAIDLAPIDKPAEISQRVKQEVNTILLELSKFKYDPEAYKKLVRDRKGWSDLLTESDDGDGS